jgi:hypothetical protein
MIKLDWEKLKVTFWHEHKKTGVSVQDWCNKYQLNYNTARRYIKVRVIKKNINLQFKPNQAGRSRIIAKRRGPPLGSQNALKHGGYSKCFYDGSGQVTEAISKEDVLILCRNRIHLVISEILRITKELERTSAVDMIVKLYNNLFLADLAIDKNVATIEFITRQMSSHRLKKLKNRIN